MSPSGHILGGKKDNSNKSQIKRQGSLMRDTGTSFLNRAEITRNNFFSNDDEKDIGLYDVHKKPEDEKILETKIDPLEWK